MPKLILQKTLDEITRAEFEEFIKGVQAKRLAAAVVYFETRKQKLEKIDDRLRDRIIRQTEMLGKDIDKIDLALVKMQERLDTLMQLEHQAGIVQDQIDEVEQGTREE